MQIGRHVFPRRLVVAPMAGVTDRPFRRLCRAFGADLAVSEMVSAKPQLRGSAKTCRRLNHAGEEEPISVQIVGADPAMLAEAARLNVEHGAQIIDINMGCPAKKVCNTFAGSALLANEALVERILREVVGAVEVPVTLKIRTGSDPSRRNAVRIARIAEDAGVKALAVHGRTRACGFGGEAEYETIAAVKAAVSIPVIANGDLDTPEKVKTVLDYTRADAVMIGRAARGRPWIFREIRYFLEHGRRSALPTMAELRTILMRHLRDLYELYGEFLGVRVARKHIGWYTRGLRAAEGFRTHFNGLETGHEQLTAVDRLFADPARCGGQAERREERAA